MFPRKPLKEIECKTPSACSPIARQYATLHSLTLRYVSFHQAISDWRRLHHIGLRHIGLHHITLCCSTSHYIHTTQGEYHLVCACVRACQMKPKETQWSLTPAGSQFAMINPVQQGVAQNQFDMKDHESCVQCAPNS